MSQAWRRLAIKTSALGLASTLVAFVCSVFIVATPGTASAAVTKQYTYSCGSGGPFTNTSITVGLSAPDTVTAGQTFDLTVNIPTLTLTPAPTVAAKVSATLALTPTSATVNDATTAKEGATVTINQTAVPAGSVVYKVAVTAGATGNVTLKPGELKLGLTAGATTTSTCTAPTTAEALSVPIGTGGGGGDTDIITYDCDLVPTNTTIDPADVDIKVVLTPPTSASANADAEVKWAGTIQTTGDPLKVPTGFPTTGSKIFATIKASGAGAPATTTGEAALTGITAGSDFPATLPQITLKVKPTSTGTVTLTPGDIAFGTSATSPALKCLAPTTGLKTYTFTVGNASTSPTPTPTPTPTTTSPRPTRTSTATVTVTPSSSTSRKSQTPKAGADTGAGGSMGPDGRLFILTGTGLIAAAAVGGLVMRRRSIKG